MLWLLPCNAILYLCTLDVCAPARRLPEPSPLLALVGVFLHAMTHPSPLSLKMQEGRERVALENGRCELEMNSTGE